MLHGLANIDHAYHGELTDANGVNTKSGANSMSGAADPSMDRGM